MEKEKQVTITESYFQKVITDVSAKVIDRFVDDSDDSVEKTLIFAMMAAMISAKTSDILFNKKKEE